MKFISAACVFVCCGASNAAPAIRLNSVGFLPGQPKQASVAVAGTNFTLLRTFDNAEVFAGSLTGPLTNGHR